MSGKRANGEGSIYPFRNGYAAYAWITTPAGRRQRKYVYGKTREIVHDKWLTLTVKSKAGAVASKVPTLGAYLTGWLTDVVTPNVAPSTAANYEMFTRLYIVPNLGTKRLDKLTVRDVQTWLNQLRVTCQCCAQKKDEKRKVQKCCAIGDCCKQFPSEWTIRDAWTVIRSALSNAERDELVARNVAALARMSHPRPKKVKAWTVEEARMFLEATNAAADPRYAAYVLILVIGLRRGELLGLKWEDVDLNKGELYVGWQLQRVSGRLIRRETKTKTSEALLPLPEICIAALRVWVELQKQWREKAGDAWQDQGYVFTTRLGMPIEPRNFHRAFQARSVAAKVRMVPVHTTRKTCASLLVALDVHPRVAMQILRHSQIAVTMNVYSEVYSDSTREALKRLGDHLNLKAADPTQAADEDDDQGDDRPADDPA